MKKEMFAALLLLIIICAAFINIRLLENVTAEVLSLVDDAASEARAGDWSKAKMAAEKAAGSWEKHGSYTQIVLRHSEIDSVNSLIGELQKEIYLESEGGTKGVAGEIRTKLALMLEIERVKPGSIF